MFYRRKVILAIIEAFGGTIGKIQLQKLLLLFTKRQLKAEYDFVPYRYGCYSFSCAADLTTMVKQGLLVDVENEKSYKKADNSNYISKLNIADKKILIETYSLYGKMSKDSLMKHTYLNY